MKKKVLIVDDEVAFTNVAKLTLEGKGAYEVCIENNPRQALTTARRFFPDIIILDVVMPGLDGGEVRSQFMADPIMKRTPIIFLTAIVRHKEVEENKGVIGGAYYLAKPVSAEALTQAIEKHMRA